MKLFFLSTLFFLLQSSIYFYEPFEKGALGSSWIVTKDEKFNGTWALENRKADYSNGSINGIVTKSPSAYHAISIKKEFTAASDTFVLQFENKIQSTSFSCGGSYVKLLSEDFDTVKFNNQAPFVIMFGPDKCGETNLVQFIYRTLNPLSKVWSEHKLKTKVTPFYDNVTHLYTLVIKKDDTFEIKVDNKVKTSGSLHNASSFDAPFEPPKLIPDVNDKKPADWVDAEQIPDANETKPADWDETAPPTIPDAKATKPADWKDTEPLQIIDPNGAKPEEWDDKEDGTYKPALIDNPYCAEHGCGPWSPPQIKNPAFKGKWKPKMVANPAFKGKWKPREVDNPYYYTPEKNLHIVGTIYGLGFELVSPVEQWFSSIYVGDSVEEAENLAKERWVSVNAQEVAAKGEAAAKKKKDERSKLWGKLSKGSWRDRGMVLAELAHDVYVEHTVLTIIGIVVLIGVLVGLGVGCWACCCAGKEEEEGANNANTTRPDGASPTGEEKKKEGEENDENKKKGEEDGKNEGEEDEDEEEEEEEEEEKEKTTTTTKEKEGKKKKK